MFLAVQTGLRLSELTGLRREDLHWDAGAHIRCLGKGRKERCTPLTKQSVAIIKSWLQESGKLGEWLFTTMHGRQLSRDAIQDILAKHHRRHQSQPEKQTGNPACASAHVCDGIVASRC